MSKKITFIFILLFIFGGGTLSAQENSVPKGINYQAVARNPNGTPIINRNVSIQFSVLEGSVSGPVIYSERHQIGTGSIGVFNLEIGKGNPTTGNWNNVDWRGLPKFLRTEIDPAGGTNFNLMGTTPFLTVPYAFVSEHALNASVKTDNSLTGNGTNLTPLKLAGQSAVPGQVLKWNGSAWVPGNDDLNGSGSPLAVSPRLAGNGTAGSPLDIAGMGARIGQVLTWNGSAWSPADASGSGNVFRAVFPLEVRTVGNETTYGLQNAPAEGNTLVWSGGRWTFRSGGVSLSAGNGIEITGNQISSNIWRLNGDKAFYNRGFVGIGTDNPPVPLDVVSNSNPDRPHFRLFETESDFSRMSFENSSSNEAFDIVGRPEGGGFAGRLNFFYTRNNLDIMSLTDEGIVGIGTVDPENTTRLDVVSGNQYAGLYSSNFIDDRTTVINAFFDAQARVDAVAVAGTCEAAPGKGFGGQFYGGNVGVLGTANPADFAGDYAAIGVYGESNGLPDRRTGGTRIGVYGFGKGGEFNMGVYGGHNGAGRVNWAGFFEGDVNVTGFIRKAGGTFVIDHPTDPENKLLYHSFVESPDMMNIYNGNVISDSTGTARVNLPGYFEALNKDFRYQLTVIGKNASAWVEKEVENNVFVIKTSVPGLKVSWQVTGIRKDPFAEKNRIVPEVEKAPSEKGKYLHPEVYGKSKEQYMYSGFVASTVRRPQLPQRKYLKPGEQSKNSSGIRSVRK